MFLGSDDRFSSPAGIDPCLNICDNRRFPVRRDFQRQGEDVLSIIRQTISQLPVLRSNPSHWDRCAYAPFVHPEWGKQDANSRERHRFLIALQYERQPDDEALVRYLFDQEVIARSSDDFQGIGEALRLASYLLSQWRRSGDLWRFAAAKCANFDTWCGYASQFLCAAGHAAALAEFASSDHELKETIRELLFDEQGSSRFSSQEIEEWRMGLVDEFPSRPEEEPLNVEIDRAIAFGLRDEGLILLDRFEASGTETSLSSLSSLREQLGDLKGAIRHRLALLESSQDDWDRVSNACSLADLFLQDQRPADAWAAICNLDNCLARIEGWNEVGLGRNVVAVAFRIAQAASPDFRHVAFEWACSHEAKLQSSSWQIFNLAHHAALALGDSARANHYQAAADAERLRIDQELTEIANAPRHDD